MPASVKVGCIGQATAKVVSSFQKRVDFLGQGSSESVALAFAKEISHDDHVLFPAADSAAPTVSRHLYPHQAIQLPIYRTAESPPQQLPKADLWVLTSPSNAKALSKVNGWPGKSKIIAIGKTTAAALEALDISTYTVAWEPSERALADALFSC